MRSFSLRRLAVATVFALAAQMSSAAHVDLDVVLDPLPRRLSATATLHFAKNEERAFALSPEAVIERVQVDGRDIAPKRDAREGRVLYRIPATAADGPVTVAYRLELAPLDTARDHRGVLGGLPAMADEKGSFLPAGSGWYPEPKGDFSYAVALSVPDSQRAIVPGKVADESEAGGRYRARFEFPHPAQGIDVMAGPYVVRERTARIAERDLRLRTYFAPDLGTELSDDYLAAVERYLRLYSDWIGPYPFEGFSVVSSPLPTGFGMPTLTYLGVQVIRLPFIRDTSLGHEVLHNWWGNSVYPAYARGNWSEGLTTFMADYAYKERAGAAAAREMRHGWLRDYVALPLGEESPLADFTSRSHSASAAVGYGKAAMVFYMVREQIGAEAFDRAIRAFYRDYRFQHTSWADLEAAFSKASGQSLAPLFQQWLARIGAPQVSVTKASAGPVGSGWRLTLGLSQGVPPYRLDVPVVVQTNMGQETFRVALSKKSEAVAVTVQAQPVSVTIDPDFQLWRRLAQGESPPIVREAIAARDPVIVVADEISEFRNAAESLAKALLELPARFAKTLPGDAPVAIVMGTPASVAATLAAHGLEPRPEVAERGTAQVWTVRKGRQTVLAIAAQDADALSTLARALPHLGGQSWVVFEGGKPIARGVWKAESPSVPVAIVGG